MGTTKTTPNKGSGKTSIKTGSTNRVKLGKDMRTGSKTGKRGY